VSLPSGGIFECGTEDISVAGISLDTVIPAAMPKTFSAELMWNDVKLKLVCNRVNDRSLKILEVSNWDLFKQWLVGW
jgi:hypothetical protein